MTPLERPYDIQSALDALRGEAGFAPLVTPNTYSFAYAGTLVGSYGEGRHVFTRNAERSAPGEVPRVFVVQLVAGAWALVS